MTEGVEITLYEQAAEWVKELFQSDHKEELIAQQVGVLCSSIINDLGTTGTFLKKTRGRLARHYFVHSHIVSTCVTSLRIGMKLGLGRDELMDLGYASLVYDLGLSKVPPEIINKRGTLIENEYNEIQKHPAYAREILEGVKGIREQILEIVYQHHERCDGTGYPQGLKGEDIHKLAKILAVADVFEAVIRPRSWRDRLFPYDIVGLFTGSQGVSFDYDAVKTLMTFSSVFPIGSILELSSGELAEVIGVDSRHLLRPQVKIIYDPNHIPPVKEEVVDLIERPSKYIKRVVADSIENLQLKG